MANKLPNDFVIPLELTEYSNLWRVMACELILADEQTGAAALERLEPRERGVLESEIEYLTLSAKMHGFNLRFFAEVLRQTALDKETTSTSTQSF